MSKDIKKQLDLLKAKIIDMKSRKVLADLPSDKKTEVPKSWDAAVSQTAAEGPSKETIRSARFGTPEGSIWLSTHHDGTKSSHGVGLTRDESRKNALGGKTPGKTGHPDFIPEIGKEAAEHKQGHLVVGANNYLRNKLPFFLLQQYDHHIIHHQDEQGTHHVGVIALHRQHPDHAPIVTHASGETGEKALTGALHQQLIEARPTEFDEDHNPVSSQKSGAPHQSKKNTWLTHWIYRQPKKSLKDLLTGEEPKMAKSMELEPGQSILEKAKILEFGSGKVLADLPKDKKNASPGPEIGKTQSGRPVFANSYMHDKDFSREDHIDASNIHHSFFEAEKSLQSSAPNQDILEWHSDHAHYHGLMSSYLGYSHHGKGQDKKANKKFLDEASGIKERLAGKEMPRPTPRLEKASARDLRPGLSIEDLKHMPVIEVEKERLDQRDLNTQAMHYHLAQAARHTLHRDELERQKQFTAAPDRKDTIATAIQNHHNAMKAHQRKARQYYDSGLVVGTEYGFDLHVADHLAGQSKTVRTAPPARFIPHASEKIQKSLSGQAEAELLKGKIFSFSSGKLLADTGKKKQSKIGSSRYKYLPGGPNFVDNLEGPSPHEPVTAENFEPLPDKFLESKNPLSWAALNHIERHVEHSSHCIDQCNRGPRDDNDVLDWHVNYLTRLENRILNSKDAIQQKNKDKK
jgi:hypothetical protein